MAELNNMLKGEGDNQNRRNSNLRSDDSSASSSCSDKGSSENDRNGRLEIVGEEEKDEKPYMPVQIRFREQELKPTQIQRKSQKVLVKDEDKDDRYWEKRKKNNMAAKRSREARRSRENQIAVRASFLEKDNALLKEELLLVKEELQAMKEQLLKAQNANQNSSM